MIKVVAKNYPMQDKQEEIMKLADELVRETRKEPGNISYAVCRDVGSPEIMAMIEEWESREALDRHLNSEHFKRIVPVMGKYMTREADVSVYEQVL